MSMKMFVEKLGLFILESDFNVRLGYLITILRTKFREISEREGIPFEKLVESQKDEITRRLLDSGMVKKSIAAVLEGETDQIKIGMCIATARNMITEVFWRSWERGK